VICDRPVTAAACNLCRLDKIPKLLTNDELRAVLIEEVGAGEAEGKEAPAAVVQVSHHLLPPGSRQVSWYVVR
jgi:hypothetical protein